MTVTRRLSPLLLAGMLTFPVMFCWLFLRRGYEPSLRRTAFTYTGVAFLVPVVGMLWG